MFNTLEATKKFMIIVILAKLMYSYRASGFIFTTSNVVGCQDSTAKIDFNFDLQGDSIAVGSKVWNLNRSIIAVDTGSGFTALGNYSSRLTNHSSHGLTLSSVTTADAGKYDYDIFLIAGNTGATITTNLAVYVAPTPGCSVYTNQTGDNVTCYINTVNGSCGYPELHPGWVNVTNSSSFICAQEGTYQCCATGPAQTICLPSSSYCVSFTCSRATTPTTTVTSAPSSSGSTSSTTTTTKPSSATSTATNNNTSAHFTTRSTSPAATQSSTSTNKSMQGGVDINVIVPAVVVPGGLLLIGAIILVVVLYKRHHRAGKNIRETQESMASPDRDSNVDGWKQSLEHGRAADKLNAVYTTPSRVIIYPGPAAMFTARPHKDKTKHDVTDQYNRAYTGTYSYQDADIPNTYTSARSYTDKGKIYDNKEPICHQAPQQMAARRPAYTQTAYYPQTGYYGQIDEDVCYRGGGGYSYGQRSRSHNAHNGRQQQREYYNQYEMAKYGGSRVGYGQTKQYGQDTDFYY